MKLYFFLFFVCNTVLAQDFWIPDSNFRNAIKMNYPSCLNKMDKLIIDKASKIISLDIANQNISSIEGIHLFKNLDTLICSFNKLQKIDVIPYSLKYFRCDSNLLEKLPKINDGIKCLNCDGNLISNIEYLPESLISLSISYNLFNKLPLLPKNLKLLNCDHNNLDSIFNLPPNLKTLNVDFNKIVYIDFIPKSLINLSCISNKLKELPTLPDSLIRFISYINNFEDKDKWESFTKNHPYEDNNVNIHYLKQIYLNYNKYNNNTLKLVCSFDTFAKCNYLVLFGKNCSSIYFVSIKNGLINVSFEDSASIYNFYTSLKQGVEILDSSESLNRPKFTKKYYNNVNDNDTLKIKVTNSKVSTTLVNWQGKFIREDITFADKVFTWPIYTNELPNNIISSEHFNVILKSLKFGIICYKKSNNPIYANAQEFYDYFKKLKKKTKP